MFCVEHAPPNTFKAERRLATVAVVDGWWMGGAFSIQEAYEPTNLRKKRIVKKMQCIILSAHKIRKQVK